MISYIQFSQFCLKRNVYIVEDEFHLFLVCPVYAAIRELYCKPEWKNTVTTKHTIHNMESNAN